jgi:hypothetical protein
MDGKIYGETAISTRKKNASIMAVRSTESLIEIDCGILAFFAMATIAPCMYLLPKGEEAAAADATKTTRAQADLRYLKVPR